jgi:hypothetical protein
MDREMKHDDRVDEMSDEFELTPEEKMAFQELPRESEASDLLEERVVRSLREEGILATSGGEGGAVMGTAAPGRGLWLRPWMAAAAVAASLALFTSGIFLGQSLGTRSTAQAFLAVREQDATQLAMTIQEAGSQYVSALAALGELRIPDPNEGGSEEGVLLSAADLQQGREVALGALYGAAYELARMSPEDMDVLQILRIMEERKDREEGYAGNARNVVWF